MEEISPDLPCTSNVICRDAVPASFDAMQTYLPASSSLTDVNSIVPESNIRCLSPVVGNPTPSFVHVMIGSGKPMDSHCRVAAVFTTAWMSLCPSSILGRTVQTGQTLLSQWEILSILDDSIFTENY